MIRVSPRWSRPRRLTTALRIVSAMIRVSPRWSRPRCLITALRVVSAMISQPPSIPASPLDHRLTNRLCYDRSQLLSIQPSQLDLSLSSHLQELGIGFHLSSKRSCRGRKRKQRKISACCVRRQSCIYKQWRPSITRNEVNGLQTPRTCDWCRRWRATLLSDFLQFKGSQFCQPDSCQCPSFYCHLITPYAIEDHKGTVL